MPNITTIDRFTDPPVKIPEAVNESAGVDENAGLEAVITEQERIILKEALGKDQYAVLQVELTKKPFNPASPDDALPEYVELVLGSTDEVWQGLHPMLDNFIFCAWMRESEVKTMAIGSGKGRVEGFTQADNSSKFAQRWNVFVSNLSDLREYLEESVDFELPSEFPYYETTNSLGL